MEQFTCTYYTRSKFPQNVKVVSICPVDKTLVRMFSGKTIYEKNKLSVATTLSNYHLPVRGCSGNQKLLVYIYIGNILVRGDSTLVFY